MRISKEQKCDMIARLFDETPAYTWLSVRDVALKLRTKSKLRVHEALREMVSRGFLVEHTLQTLRSTEVIYYYQSAYNKDGHTAFDDIQF